MRFWQRLRYVEGAVRIKKDAGRLGDRILREAGVE
jgi:ABC-type long-subunit fatty acid transport system fused permease/ATPase subunit